MKYEWDILSLIENWELNHINHQTEETSDEINKLIKQMLIYKLDIDLSDFNLKFRNGKTIADFRKIKFKFRVEYDDIFEAREAYDNLRIRLPRILYKPIRKMKQKDGKRKVVSNHLRFEYLTAIAKSLPVKSELIKKMIVNGVAKRTMNNQIVPTEEYLFYTRGAKWNVIYIKTRYPDYCHQIREREVIRERESRNEAITS